MAASLDDIPLELFPRMIESYTPGEKFLFAGISTASEEICRKTPIRFTNASFRLLHQNNWYIELLRGTNPGLVIYPVYQGDRVEERIRERFPTYTNTFPMEVVKLETTVNSWPATLERINMATRTIFKIFQIDNIDIRVTSDFGIMNLSLWLRCNTFESIFIDSGRSLTHGELRFILRLRTEKLSIFPRVEPRMSYEGQLHYKTIQLKEATWLSGNGLLKIHAEEIKITEFSSPSFTAAKVRQYMEAWGDEQYENLKVMKIILDTQGLPYEDLFNELTRGMQVLQVDLEADFDQKRTVVSRGRLLVFQIRKPLHIVTITVIPDFV